MKSIRSIKFQINIFAVKQPFVAQYHLTILTFNYSEKIQPHETIYDFSYCNDSHFDGIVQ